MAGFTYKITIEPVSVGSRSEVETCHFGDGKWATLPAGRREFILNKTGVDNDTTKEQVVQIIQGVIIGYEGNQALGGDPTSGASSGVAVAVNVFAQ